MIIANITVKRGASKNVTIMIALTSKFPWVRKLSFDEELHWHFEKITDFVRSLVEMTVPQLAAELSKAQVNNDIEKKIIVEHMLARRLAYIQSKASWGAGWLSFIGAAVGAILAFFLGGLAQQNPTQVVCSQAQQDIQRPVPTASTQSLTLRSSGTPQKRGAP